MSLLINGREAKFIGNSKLSQNITKTFDEDFSELSVGYFVGQLTDFNVWNILLSPEQLQTIALNCSDEITSTFPPQSINWTKFIMGESYNSSLKFAVPVAEACYISPGLFNFLSA
jgi:hypothetical protein